MRVNEVGKIVEEVWHELMQRFPLIELDEFIVMPNHIHGIIRIVGAPLAGALIGEGPTIIPPAVVSVDRMHPINQPAGRTCRGTTRHGVTTRVTRTGLGDIVGAFKSIATVCWIKYQQNHGICVNPKLWQRNYYERIIRSERELHNVQQYVRDNPLKWSDDPEYPR